MSQHYKGVGGTTGIAIGPAYCHMPDTAALHPVNEDADAALARLSAAQQAAAEYLYALERQLRDEGRIEEADILDTQALFIEDMAITNEIIRRVREECEPLDSALKQTIQQFHASFEALDDPYWQERASDIDAAGQAVLAALRGTSAALPDLPPGVIILAPDLTPAETAGLRGGTVAGFATAYGGATGHTAIMARSLGIPAVVGLGAEVLDIPTDSDVILDAEAGLLIVHPEVDERAYYLQRLQAQQDMQQRRQALHDQQGQLADGHAVALWANIGHPNEVALALEHGAQGIGLFRTEFLFLERISPPDEDEQYAAYRHVLEAMSGRTVVIRTLDIGGDKPIHYLNLPTEANPFLGVRGLRLCMQQPELFRSQLRALLRAAVHGDLWVMLPMVATPGDLAWAQAQLQAAADSLEAEGTAYRRDIPLGIMIETPAAVITADLLAYRAAFFSIGSNDLTQYTMAADRGNAELAQLYPHDAPAVLRMIAQAAAAANAASIPIGICGELAGVPDVAPLLAGLGLGELSMAPASIPVVKERLLAFTLEAAQLAAQRAMQGDS
jgi:phosphotransferase system enzyme I (PtsI)